jgi:hypothetical protein
VALKEVAGVFSRRFIVGFFIPVFFAAFAVTQLIDERALPEAYRDASGTTQTLIVGAVALLLALLLSGLHFSLLRFLEGYWLLQVPIARASPRPAIVRWYHAARLSIGTRMKKRWIQRRAHLLRLRDGPPSPERTAAARRLERRFPASEANVLPTELGNAIRAFETHPRLRYGLDGIAVWPRVSALLTDGERTELEDAETDLAFWLNAMAVVTGGGIVLFGERLWHTPGGLVETLAIELAVVVATVVLVWFMYRQAITAADRWGDPVRAAFDVHRFGLYDTFGLRRPTNSDEDVEIGNALNRLIAFAEPIPNPLRAPRDG